MWDSFCLHLWSGSSSLFSFGICRVACLSPPRPDRPQITCTLLSSSSRLLDRLPSAGVGLYAFFSLLMLLLLPCCSRWQLLPVGKRGESHRRLLLPTFQKPSDSSGNFWLKTRSRSDHAWRERTAGRHLLIWKEALRLNVSTFKHCKRNEATSKMTCAAHMFHSELKPKQHQSFDDAVLIIVWRHFTESDLPTTATGRYYRNIEGSVLNGRTGGAQLSRMSCLCWNYRSGGHQWRFSIARNPDKAVYSATWHCYSCLVTAPKTFTPHIQIYLPSGNS